MDRREKSKVLTSSGNFRTERPIQQKLPTRSDRTYQHNSQLEQETGEAERSYRYSSSCEGFDPSSRCTVHTPTGDMALESPCSPEVSEGSEYGCSESEGSSETEPPVKNGSNSASTDSGTDSDSNDSSSDSSSNDSSSSGSTSSNDDLNFSESANIPSQGVAASAPRNNLLATNSRASKESLRSHVDQNTSPSSNVVFVETELVREPMSFPHCNAEDRAEERKKQAIEPKAEESPFDGYYLSSKQVAQQQRPCVSKTSLETGAADSSTDSGMNPRFHPVLGTRSISVDEENVSHIPLPSLADGGSSLDPTEASRPRNLVRIVMKKSGVTRGISAKKLTKNPVINIFGEIVFDGCTFEGESRTPAARATDILSPLELGQKELESNSEEIRNRVYNDILQKGIRRETGEGGRGGEDILQKGIGRETGEGRGRGGAGGGGGNEYLEEVDRQEILGGGKIKDEGKSLLIGEKLKDSRNNSVHDISKNLQVNHAEKSTERFPKRLVDYDDDDFGSCQERSSSEGENTFAPSASRISQKKDLQRSEGTRSGQRNRRHRPELSRSYSRKRRHSASISSCDERDSVDGSEHPEPSFDAKHRSEIIRNRDDRSSCTTGLKVRKNSEKKFSDPCCSDLQRHTTEKMEQKWDGFDRSESQTTRRNLARSSTATTLEILGTKESTDRPRHSEVERNHKMKAVASAARSKSEDQENLENEANQRNDLSDDEELKRRESRRPRDDSLRSEMSNKRMSSSQRPTSAKTFSPDCFRVRSHLQRGPRISHTRAATPDRSRKSRRSEIRYGETEARRSERRRRSSEGPDDFASGKERLDKTRRRSRASSDRNGTEQILDETRNAAVSKSAGIGCRSTTNRSEQSGKSRSRSSTAYDDASNRQSSRRHSSASTSLKSCPEEIYFRVGHGQREKTRHAETRSPSGDHRGDESGTTRPSASGKLSSSERGKRAGEGRGERTRTGSSKDRTVVVDHYSHTDNYHQRENYYPNDWIWSTRNPDHLKETPEPYPFPYLHPFAQPFASPMLRFVYNTLASLRSSYLIFRF